MHEAEAGAVPLLPPPQQPDELVRRFRFPRRLQPRPRDHHVINPHAAPPPFVSATRILPDRARVYLTNVCLFGARVEHRARLHCNAARSVVTTRSCSASVNPACSGSDSSAR